MPGMRERKLHMMGETKSSRGDYGVKVMGTSNYKKKARRP